MPTYTAFSIQLWTGAAWDAAITFDNHEVGNLAVFANIDLQILASIDSYPIPFDVGRIEEDVAVDQKVVSVELKNYYETTLAKIKSILECTYKARVYYQPAIDSSYLDCIVDPNYEEVFYAGENLWNYSILLRLKGPTS